MLRLHDLVLVNPDVDVLKLLYLIDILMIFLLIWQYRYPYGNNDIRVKKIYTLFLEEIGAEAHSSVVKKGGLQYIGIVL